MLLEKLLDIIYDSSCMNEMKMGKTSQLSGTHEYKKRLLLGCIHHFKSDLINNMDHMGISGTEPSSVILSQTK